jgi:hypothetical protein
LDPDVFTHWMRVFRSPREPAGEVLVPEWLLAYRYEVGVWADEQVGQRAGPDTCLVPVGVALELLDDVLKDMGPHP